MHISEGQLCLFKIFDSGKAQINSATWTRARAWTLLTVGPATEETPATAWVPTTALTWGRAWTPVKA